MRLKKIVLDGFKSFADRTEFTFDSDITGIVGPNGCGKSNVVDAVKWVLGEQKVKNLRSDRDGRRDLRRQRQPQAAGLGRGDAGALQSAGHQRAGFPSTRKRSRYPAAFTAAASSEYRINGKLCRLKDLRELFMDTGVATRAYSIIEQGQVDQLVSASKVDRRLVFEEAAGISKYKAHKKEALRKLEHTEQNLLRLADILEEVAKRLRSVKLQAGKARNYLEYTQRLKELQVNFSLVEYGKNKEQLDEKSAVLHKAEDEFSAVAAEEAGAEAEASRLGNEIIEKEHRLSETGNALVAAQSKIDQKVQRIEFLRARTVELEQRRNAAAQEIERLRAQGEALKADLANHQR